MNRRESSTAMSADWSWALRHPTPQQVRTISWLHRRTGFYPNTKLGRARATATTTAERGLRRNVLIETRARYFAGPLRRLLCVAYQARRAGPRRALATTLGQLQRARQATLVLRVQQDQLQDQLQRSTAKINCKSNCKEQLLDVGWSRISGSGGRALLSIALFQRCSPTDPTIRDRPRSGCCCCSCRLTEASPRV